MKNHKSNSDCQRKVEKFVVQTLEERLCCKLWEEHKTPVECGGVKFEFDFYNKDKNIIGEVFARIGQPKPGQVKKTLTDAFKLVSYEKLSNSSEKWEKIIVFVDKTVKACFENNKHWYAKAIEKFGITLECIDLPPALRDQLIKTQALQAEGMKGPLESDK